MTLDFHRQVDPYASRIEDELHSFWDFDAFEALRLETLANDVFKANGLADQVFLVLKNRGELPELAELIDGVTDEKVKRNALDTMAQQWSGENLAELSDELQRLGSESGLRSVLDLSQAVARLQSTEAREDYIDAMASRSSNGVSNTFQWGTLTSATRADIDNLAVAQVWASFADHPILFESVGYRLNVGSAVAAAAHAVSKSPWIGHATTTYDTGLLTELLRGAAVSSPPLKLRILKEASAVADEIEKNPLTPPANKELARKSLEPGLQTLLAEHSAGVRAQLEFKTEKLTENLKTALADSNSPLHAVQLALGSSITPVASRAFASLDRSDMQALAVALHADLLAMRRTGQESASAASIVERMNGEQLGRLIDVYLNDSGSSGTQREDFRFALPMLAQLIGEHTLDAGDKVEVIQRLIPLATGVPLVRRDDANQVTRLYPNPEASAVATVLASMSAQPSAFTLAMSSVPLGPQFTAVLMAAADPHEVRRDGRVPVGHYQLGLLNQIVIGLSFTRFTDRKCQVAADTDIVLQKIEQHVRNLHSQLRATTDGERKQRIDAEIGLLAFQFDLVQKGVVAMIHELGPQLRCRVPDFGQPPRLVP